MKTVAVVGTAMLLSGDVSQDPSAGKSLVLDTQIKLSNIVTAQECPKDIYKALESGCATGPAKALILGHTSFSPKQINPDDIAGAIAEALVAEEMKK